MSVDQLTDQQRVYIEIHIAHLRRTLRTTVAQILADALAGRTLSETARARVTLHAKYVEDVVDPGTAIAIRWLIAAGPPKVNSLPIGGPVATP